MMFKLTAPIEEPLVVNHDKPNESNEVLNKDQPQTNNEPVIQTPSEEQTPSIPFPRRLRKEKEEAQQRKFLENLKQLDINLPFIKALAQMPKYAKLDHKGNDGIDDGKLKEEIMMVLVKMEGMLVEKVNAHENAPFARWENHSQGPYANAKTKKDYDPYLDIYRNFGRNYGSNNAGIMDRTTQDTEYSRKGQKRKPKASKSKNGLDKDKVKVSSMAEIDSKEAQKKSKAGVCFKTYLTQQAHLFLLSPKKHKLQVEEMKTSAIYKSLLIHRGIRGRIVFLDIEAANFEDQAWVANLSRTSSSSDMDMRTHMPTSGAARIWLEKEPPRSIQTWDDLVAKFINQFFPPSKTTNLRNEITNFKQRFDESFSEAWDRFKDLLRACGNFLDKKPADCSSFSESTSKVRNSRKGIILWFELYFSTADISQFQLRSRKAVEAKLCYLRWCPSYRNCRLPIATNSEITSKNTFASSRSKISTRKFGYVRLRWQNQIRPPGFPPMQHNHPRGGQQSESLKPEQNRGNGLQPGSIQRHQVQRQAPMYQPPANQHPVTKSRLYQAFGSITPESGVSFGWTLKFHAGGGSETEVTKGHVLPKRSTKDVQPPIVHDDEPVVMPRTKTTLPYPSRVNKEKISKKDDLLALKFMEIFRNLHFELSFADALLHMPKFAPMFRKLLNNKDKILDLTKTPVNENCSAVILKTFPEKLGDPGRFLIPCDFPELDECLALADLGASINLMPLSVFEKLKSHGLTKIGWLLELANRSIYHFPAGIARRCFCDRDDLKNDEIRDFQCFSEVLANGNSTPSFEPIVDTTSPTLTPFEGSDFILEEIEAELSDTSYKSGIVDAECDPEEDILLLEAILNSEPLSPLSNHANYFPEVRKELKICEAKTNETSIDEPSEVELKDLPPHLEYAFLEGDNKLPVIIAKDLSVLEKAALIKVLQSHKRAIAWKLSDIKGINPGILYSQNSNGRGLHTSGPTSETGKPKNPRCHQKRS
ncbi:reverse transcriptase domain-containing protein [Tanacetum coccineum]